MNTPHRKTLSWAIVRSAVFLSKNPLAAYKFPWFFALRMTKTDHAVVRLTNGLHMRINLRSHMGKTLFFYGSIDGELADYIDNHMRTDSVFFDIGANDGFFSLHAARRCRNGSVHAFEPVANAQENLATSIHINKLTNIRINPTCMGDYDGEVQFHSDRRTDVSGIKPTIHQDALGLTRITSPISRLDTYVQNNSIGRIDLIKIDTEGAEKLVLEGGQKTLKTFRPILHIELSSTNVAGYDYPVAAILQMLSGLSYVVGALSTSGSFVPLPHRDVYDENAFAVPAERLSPSQTLLL